MIRILAHRGTWNNATQQNTIKSFERSLDLEVGIETDVRNHGSKIIIMHDIPKKKKFIYLDNLFDLYKSKNSNQFLALNIKSDGIRDEIIRITSKYNIRNYFVFDMSVPEMINYSRSKIKFLIRISEFEKECNNQKKLNHQGVWIDQFNEDWLTRKNISRYLKIFKHLCIVSPECHKRNYINMWSKIKYFNNNHLHLCTDHPIEAKKFFYE